MRKDLYHEMYQLESTYWWYVGRRQLILQLLNSVRPEFPTASCRLCDAGSGTGMLMAELADYGQIAGLDLSEEALSFCKRRGLKDLIKSDFSKPLPIRSNSQHVVTCLDVAEHVDNDRSLFAEFYRILAWGGYLFVTVPAYPRLWTYWDEILAHKRRYTKRSLTEKLIASGFEMERVSYFYSFLLPIAVVFRMLKSLFGGRKQRTSDLVPISSPVNELLLFIAGLERQVLKFSTLPFGLSLVGACKKIKRK